MSRKIEIDNDIVEYLEKHGRFPETYSDVLRRRLKEFAVCGESADGANESAEAANSEEDDGPEDVRSRNEYPNILGYPVSTLIRALGFHGWSIEEAEAAFRLMGITPKPLTFKAQIFRGEQWAKQNPHCLQKNKPYGTKPPKLTPEQLAGLREGKIKPD